MPPPVFDYIYISFYEKHIFENDLTVEIHFQIFTISAPFFSVFKHVKNKYRFTHIVYQIILIYKSVLNYFHVLGKTCWLKRKLNYK